jgi:hypothetical protein
MTCVTLERTGERFCTPRCSTGGSCDPGTQCIFVVVNNDSFCIPDSSTCLTTQCSTDGCPSGYSCDAASGRCYRSGGRLPCQTCSYSYECGGYSDRCVLVDTVQICGSACGAGGTCPDGYQCQTAQTPTNETVHQCIPVTYCETLLYCAACTRDEDCTGGHCATIPSGKRCVPHCDLTGTCPTGASCTLYPADQSYVCTPTGGCP